MKMLVLCLLTAFSETKSRWAMVPLAWAYSSPDLCRPLREDNAQGEEFAVVSDAKSSGYRKPFGQGCRSTEKHRDHGR
jgi:hypothetical protein